MRYRSLLVIFISALVLNACTTGYGGKGLLGRGVEAEILAPDRLRVSAKTSYLTGSRAANDYVYLKAAEETLSMGYTHFIVQRGSSSSPQVVGISTPIRAVTNTTGSATIVGNTAYGSSTSTTNFYGGTQYYGTDGSAEIIVKLLNEGDVTEEMVGSDWFDAQSVVDYLKPLYVD